MKRKTISIILALALCVSLTGAVFAASDTHATIYNTNGVEGLEGWVDEEGVFWGILAVNSESPVTITVKLEGSDRLVFSDESYIDDESDAEKKVSDSGRTFTYAEVIPEPTAHAGVDGHMYAFYVATSDGLGRAADYAFTVLVYANDVLISTYSHGGDTGNTNVTTDQPSSWAAEEVAAAIAAGLVPEGLQKDYQSDVSRGSVAQMFINLIEQASGQSIDDFMAAKGVTINESAFTDTTDKAVLAANALGIINGLGDGKFGPDGTLTRAQIAAIINRVASVMGVETEGYSHEFTDVEGHWVSDELGWPVHAGVINGYDDGTFRPNVNLNTEQAIAITFRALAPLSK